MFFALLAAMLFVGNLRAHDFQVGGICYNRTNSSAPYTVEVTFQGNRFGTYSGSLTIPASVTYQGTSYSVTAIGSRAFQMCSGLTSVSIPASVTSIGDFAFADCSGLSSLTLPDSIKSIGDGAFYGCTGLTSITIPSSVKNMGDYVFSRCSGLTSITVDTANTRYMSQAGVLYTKQMDTIVCCPSGKTGSFTIDTVRCIGNYAFEKCVGLTSVTIPATVTAIGMYAFDSCVGITSITMPNSVTHINQYAFDNCSGLTTINIPQSVSFIDGNVFAGCTSLTAINVTTGNTYYTSVDGVLFNAAKTHLLAYPGGKQGSYTIPNTVNYVYYNAFKQCAGITSVVIPTSVSRVGHGAFWTCPNLSAVSLLAPVSKIDEYTFYGCGSLAHINIPGTVDTIAECAFAGCTSLDSLRISNGVTFIGKSAFNGCSGMVFVDLPRSLKKIDEWAFAFSGLTSVTIPDSVVSKGQAAFAACQSLMSINVDHRNTKFFSVDGVLMNDVLYISEYPAGRVGAYTVPDTIQYVGGYAFYGSLLSEIVLHDGVINWVQPRAFYDCQNLRKLVFGKKTREIMGEAVVNCPLLDTVVFKRSAVPTIGSGAFDSVSSTGVAVVPCGKLSAYSVELNRYFSNIVEDCDNSISETEVLPMSLYPNPASETVTISGASNENEVVVINSLGQTVKRAAIDNGTASIVVSGLPKGLYLVRVGNAVRKLVVE